MANALRPSVQITEKVNVIPSINRISEATAEDFKEIGQILVDHASKIDENARSTEEAKYYGIFESLAILQAAFPVAQENGWGVIDTGTGNPKNIATHTAGVWSVDANIAPIQFYTTKANRPAVGVENVFYVVKDEKILYLYYDGGYKAFGKDGANGLNAYQVAVAFGFVGTEEEWLATLVGKSAYQSAVDTGFVGTEADWIASVQGIEGKSAYQVALDDGFVGTEAEWLISIEGAPGDPGISAYEVAVVNGFIGTEADWLLSLEGAPGDPGISAYEVAVANGFVGTEAEWLTSIEGVEGKSAYEVAVANGFVGTEAEWLASLEAPAGADVRLANVAADLSAAERIALLVKILEPAQVTVTTAVSFNTELASDGGYSQNGKNVLIQNGTNAINITVGATANGVYSFQKEGTGAITFLTSSGKTIRPVDATAVMDGAVGSTATASVVGTEISLRISNA